MVTTRSKLTLTTTAEQRQLRWKKERCFEKVSSKGQRRAYKRAKLESVSLVEFETKGLPGNADVCSNHGDAGGISGRFWDPTGSPAGSEDGGRTVQ